MGRGLLGFSVRKEKEKKIMNQQGKEPVQFPDNLILGLDTQSAKKKGNQWQSNQNVGHFGFLGELGVEVCVKLRCLNYGLVCEF